MSEGGDGDKQGHGAGVAAQPVRECLGPGGLGKGVIGGAQDGDKELCRAHLAGGAVHYRHGAAGVIHEALLPGFVGLAHGALLPGQPVAVAVAELGVADTPVRVALRVFLPDQLSRHVGTLQLLVDRGPVRRLAARAGVGIGAGIEQLGEAGIVQLGRQRPG